MVATKKTWIVLADGAHASTLEYHGPDRPLEQVEGGYLDHINEPSRNLVTNERGTVHQIVGEGRSAYERPTDPHEFEKVRFAGEVLAFLEERVNEYERLILVSPPKMLGELRRQMPKSVRQKLYAELDKDLTSLPADQIPKHLQGVLNINNPPVR